MVNMKRLFMHAVIVAFILFNGLIFVDKAQGGFGPILNNDLLVSNGGSGGVDFRGASAACDGNRYLAIWKQTDGIFGRFISKSGTMDDAFPITQFAPSLEIRPEVAFNGTHYLVVWFRQSDNSAAGHIMGQFFTPTGTPATSVLTLTDRETARGDNDLKIASNGQDYLVIWSDGRTTPAKIYGQRVSGTGNLLGANFPISNWLGRIGYAAVGFGGSKYLVIWSQTTDPDDPIYSETDIYGAFVDTLGEVSLPFVICDAERGQGSWRKAGVAFDGTYFLAVWEDFRLVDSRPYGARVSQDGTVLDPNGIDMCANPGTAMPKGPRAAFGAGNWLVAWGGPRILGVRVDSSGVVADYASGIALYKNDPAPGSQWGPELAFDGLNFLVTWLYQATSGEPFHLYAQLVGQTVDNHPPTANAGPDQTKHVGTLVTLDGSGSSDPDGDALTYSWEFIAWPGDSQPLLSDPTAVSPTFTPNQTGEYRLQLIVTDSKGAASAPDEVIISTTNSAPVAVAGPDQSILKLHQPVQLDGSQSTDADNDPLTFCWEFEVIPDGSTAVLTGANTPTPTFTPDRYGTYVVRLVVNDGWADSTPDKVMITSQNVAPVANAGLDQSITQIDTVVTLDGSGSSDANGDQLTYQWSLISRPEGSQATLSDPAAVWPTFVADKHGVYVAQLTVNDGFGGQDTATVTISFENIAPVAAAGDDIPVKFYNTKVTLDGSQSYDDNGDDLTYTWSFTFKPEGSLATLEGADTATPSFVVDKHGDYIVQLTVSDGFGGTDSDTVTVSFENLPPVADAGTGGTFPVGQTVNLNGSGSTDPNDDPLTYTWSLISQPAGSAAAITEPSAPETSMTLDVKGDYQVQLVVNDGDMDSEPHVISFTAILDSHAVIVAIQELQHETIAALDSAAFKNSNMKNTMINKLSSVAANIEAGNYQEALGQLQHDLLAKTDGCATSGAPDKNDWIKDCKDQEEIYGELQQIISWLKQLQ
jgi:hypothetical protein